MNDLSGILTTNFYRLIGKSNVQEEKAAIEKLSSADAADIKTIGESQLELSAVYYKTPLIHSQLSFLLMLIAAVVCLLSFVAAIAILIFLQQKDIAYISGIGSAISAFFGGIFFLMYRHASNQAFAYKPQVDKIQQFIMAISTCETFDKESKQRKREEIINWFLGLPVNTSEDKK